MNRRNFVLLSGGMFATFAIPTAYHFFGKVDYPSSFAHPNSLTAILDSKELGELGVAYREQIPDESRERTIAKLLLKKLPKDNPEFNATLESLIKQDFHEGNTIEVNGWILSKTEARQCALFSFSLN